MATGDRTGIFQWPGATSVISGNYTLSQGTSPGCAVITTTPQKPPQLFGDLIITDGFGTVVIPDCRVVQQRVHGDAKSGFTYTLEIEDRRWRWRDLGTISGHYNAIDENGVFTKPVNPDTAQARLVPAVKYIPRTLRRLDVLMDLCLAAMGEVNYQVLLPDTVQRESAFPTVEWEHSNPAQALQALAETVGCVVVLRHDTNTVAVLPRGVGGILPLSGSIASESPGVSGFARPDRLLLVGKPIRHQLRFALEPVGEEFDGSIRPINQLSYAPQTNAKRHVVRWTVGVVNVGSVYTVSVNGKPYAYTAVGGDTAASICTSLQRIINAKPAIVKAGIVFTDNTVGGGAGTLDGIGPAIGQSYLPGAKADAPGTLTWKIITAGKPAGPDWSHSAPPSFYNVGVKADGTVVPLDAMLTAQLTRRQAIEKAKKSVFRYYRLVNIDPATGKAPLVVPGFGKVLYREQVVLEPMMIEQVLPQPGDLTLRNKHTGEPLIKDYYDGSSRNKPAQCFGSYFWPATGPVYPNPPATKPWNTAPDQLVAVDFSIDPLRQLVIFNEPVYVRASAGAAAGDNALFGAAIVAFDSQFGFGTVAPARLVLLTACQVLDPLTNQVRRAEAYYDFGTNTGRGLPAVIRADDFEMNFLARYPRDGAVGIVGGIAALVTNPNKVTKVLNDLPDALARSRYYLLGEAVKWEIKEAREKKYNGIRGDIFLDGAISQITWQADVNGGCTTHASRNSEHAYHLPKFPARLAWEYLRQAQKQDGGVPKKK